MDDDDTLFDKFYSVAVEDAGEQECNHLWESDITKPFSVPALSPQTATGTANLMLPGSDVSTTWGHGPAPFGVTEHAGMFAPLTEKF